MSFLSSQFSERSPLIPYARDERTNAFVVLPGKKAKDYNFDEDTVVEEYNKARHKGHLLCYDCDARVTFVREVPSKGGSEEFGTPAHYTTIPNSPHWDKCETHQNRRLDVESNNGFDKTKGFRVHLNSFGGPEVRNLNSEFGPASATGPYRRSGFKAKLTGRGAESMRRMETFAVSRVGDLVEFLSKKETSRIVQSRILHRDYNIPFEDFMLSYDPDLENGRHVKFQRFARGANTKGYRRQPVLMEVITDRPFAGRNMRNGLQVESRPIVIEPKDENGKKIVIRPTLVSRTYETDWTFFQPGRYLALGIVTMEKAEFEDSTEYKLTMRLHSEKQVIKADLAEIRLENQKHQEARDKKRGGLKHELEKALVP